MLSSTSTKNSTTVRSRNQIHLTKAALQTAYLLSEDLGAGFAERLFTSPRRHRRPDWERAILASARPGSVQIRLRAPVWQSKPVRIPTWRWGHGPTVLLVHGWEARGSQLGAFVDPLVRAGLSVVAFDAPGHGDAPDHRFYLPDVADTIADVAAEVGPLHAVIAHSFGAAGLLLAAARNELRVPRNVLVSPNVIVDDAIRRFARMVGLDDVDRLALEQRIMEHTGIDLESLRLDRLVAGRDEQLLIVHDRDDKEVPYSHGDALAAVWPQATLIPTQGLGHRKILRDPGVIAAAVSIVSSGIEPPLSDLVREVDRQLEDL